MNFDANKFCILQQCGIERAYFLELKRVIHLQKIWKMKFYKNLILQSFTQGSAILKVLYYNPKDLIFQHIPIKEVSIKTRIK